MAQKQDPAKDQFDYDSIKPLEWNEHVQKRVKMYLSRLGDGSDPNDGIYAMLDGVLALAVDEFQMGCGRGLSVEVKEDCAAVREYGRGIPLENVVWATSGISVGMGANPKDFTIPPIKVTNALSIDFYVASFRDGECSWAKYSKGNLLEKGIEKTTEENGTYIKFVPDPEVFGRYAFREGIIEGILQKIAHQNKGFSISLNGTIVPESF